MEIKQLDTDSSWQCPYCGDWHTDGERRCEDCDYQKLPASKNEWLCIGSNGFDEDPIFTED